MKTIKLIDDEKRIHPKNEILNSSSFLYNRVGHNVDVKQEDPMKTTRLIFNTVLVAIVGFLSTNAFASTYYVRTDGGTPTQCTGTANAAYPGSGTGQACALNHPSWVLGAIGTSKLLAGGDTLIIDDTNRSTGQQAQYAIGFGMPNTISANCALWWSYNCTMSPIPSGPDAAHPTRILGSSYDSGCSKKPQLWATDGVNQIFDLSSASNIDMECIELTDHSNCGLRVGSPVCAENWNSGTLSGPWGRKAVFSHTGTNFTFKNLDVHGFADRGFLMGGINGLTFSYVNMDGNYQSNWDSDVGHSNGESSMSGTVLMDHVKNRFAGCSEAYPRSSSFNTADYSNCTDQNDNPPGYGDGFGGYNTGGDWVITDSEFSHNTSDGLDLLYHDGTGSVTVQRSLFEGNDGNQLKLTAPRVTVENSVIISNCTYLFDTNKVKNRATWTSCRAGADAIAMTPGLGGVYKFSNSIFYTNGNSQVALTDRLGTCNGTETYTFRNNIYVGNGTSSLYINALSGSCATPALNTDYSIIYNSSNSACPSGAHNKCSTNPGWVNPISQTTDSNLANITLQTSSPAIASATILSGLSTLDYTSKDRGTSSWDIGALQYATSASTTSTMTTTTSKPVVAITSPTDQSVFTAGSNITINSTASETNGTISTVSFYNGSALLGTTSVAPYTYNWINAPVGSFILTAKATDTNGASTTSSSVTVTISTVTYLPVVTITNPTNPSTAVAGTTLTITASASEINGAITKIDFYNGSNLLGSSTVSPYYFAWANIPAGTYTLTAKATDLNAASTTSSPVTVNVTPAQVITPTTVNLTAPTSNTVFTGPIDITVSANASASTGNTITKVLFFNGTAQLSYVGTTSPYTYIWRNVQPGTYTMTAQATDSTGTITTSTPVNFTVNTAIAQPPVVSLISPASQASFTANSNISMTASASQTNGTITKVEFYNGSSLLGTSTTSPYSYTWNNVAEGIYSLTAKATDAAGVSVTSNTAAITVTAPVIQTSVPVVAITSPGDQSILTSYSAVTITATASTSNGSISKVDFYDGTTFLGSSTVSPYKYSKKFRSGTHTLKSKATDSQGVTAVSDPVIITVTRR